MFVNYSVGYCHPWLKNTTGIYVLISSLQQSQSKSNQNYSNDYDLEHHILSFFNYKFKNLIFSFAEFGMILTIQRHVIKGIHRKCSLYCHSTFLQFFYSAACSAQFGVVSLNVNKLMRSFSNFYHRNRRNIPLSLFCSF